MKRENGKRKISCSCAGKNNGLGRWVDGWKGGCLEGFNCGGIVAAARQEKSQQSPLGKGSNRSVVLEPESHETLRNNEAERWSDASHGLASCLPALPRLASPPRFAGIALAARLRVGSG